MSSKGNQAWGKRYGSRGDMSHFDQSDWFECLSGPARKSGAPEYVGAPGGLQGLTAWHKDRPTGEMAERDRRAAEMRLEGSRFAAWVVSPVTGWKWVLFPNGFVGWVPWNTKLPPNLRVFARSQTH